MGVSVVHRRARDKKHAPRVGPGVPLENDFQFRYWPAMHWLPLIGFVVFVGLGVGWRSWLQRCRHGSSGIVLFRSHGWAQNVREAGAIVLVALLAVQSIALAVDPQSLDRFLVVRPTPTVQWLGAVVLFIGVALMIAAPPGLGASRRIGLEVWAPPRLLVLALHPSC